MSNNTIGRKKSYSILMTALLFFLGILHCVPFYFMIINSLKPFGEIMTSFLSLPVQPTLENFFTAWDVMNYPRIFLNTLTVTVLTVMFSITASVMAGYKLERTAGRFARSIYLVFAFGILISFHMIIVPLMQQVSRFGLLNSHLFLSLFYTSGYVAFGVFLSYGFCKSIPRELEEAASIDGANPYTIFFRIIVPLLNPVIVTLAVIFVLWTWNDFIAAFLFLPDRDLRTLSPAQYMFVGTMTVEWNLFLASLILTTAPILAFYAFAQKNIAKGLTSGALKG